MKRVLVSLVLVSTVGAVYAAQVNQTSMLGSYELSEFQAQSGRVALPQDKAPTLNIARGGKISGFAGCNQYHATLKASPVAIEQVATTRKMCPAEAMELEQAFLAALGKVNALERQANGGLQLSTSGQELLQFKPVNKPVEKVIWLAPAKRDCVAGVMKTQCLQYKTSAKGEWLNFYGEIEGFTWEQGKSYKLKIRQEQIANPPADASSIKTSLVKVLPSQ
jgi:heat shock protein HslJ